MDKDFSDVEALFQLCVANMKASYPLWEEIAGRATKLHTALRYTVAATSSFLETFQKLSDFANGTRGATKDIGSSLTRLCLRHRTIENKLKAFSNALLESLIVPLQTQIDDWKKCVVQLDKDHTRDFKKAQQSVKKASTDTIRLQKKINKGKSEARSQLDAAIQEVNNRHSLLESTERNALRTALVEERKHFCFFIKCLQPIMEQEISMISEVTHLQEIVDNLLTLSENPTVLPETTEQVISDAVHGVLPPPSTLERKSRVVGDVIDADTRSNSSSTGSINQQSTASTCQLHDDLPPSTTLPVDSSHSAPNISDIPLPLDRPHTISSSVYQHSHTRPGLQTNTFEPLCEHATVTTVKSTKVADIYARPSLVLSKDGRSTGPLPVGTPTVPQTVQSTVPLTEPPAADAELCHMDSLVCETSLADAIRELEANTAALELPYNDLQAPSCQSLQCSSGYGTMTNVSTGSRYSQETIAASAADFESLAESLLECDLSVVDKYCTLPNKRSMYYNKTTTTTTRQQPPSTGMNAMCLEMRTSNDTTPTSVSINYQQYQQYQQQQQQQQHQQQRHEVTAATTADDVSSFPPPPTHLYTDLHQSPVRPTGGPAAAACGYDSDDDFPLPPPPDVCTVMTSGLVPQSVPSAGQYPLPQSLPGTGQSAVRPLDNKHAGLMQCLSVKLASRNSVVRPAPPVAAKSYKQTLGDRQLSLQHTTQSAGTGETQAAGVVGDNSLLSQIQRGMSLRRTASNDRSAPRTS